MCWFGNMWNDNFTSLAVTMIVTMIERVHLAFAAVGGGGRWREYVGKSVRLPEILVAISYKNQFSCNLWFWNSDIHKGEKLFHYYLSLTLNLPLHIKVHNDLVLFPCTVLLYTKFQGCNQHMNWKTSIDFSERLEFSQEWFTDSKSLWHLSCQ